MRQIILSGTDIKTSALGFGCSALMGSGSRAERQRLLGRALDLGVTHFDVARYYGLGQAEAELGLLLKANPGRVTVATKFGINPLPLAVAGLSRLFNRLGRRTLGKHIERIGGERSHRFKPEDARSALETSLRKLKVDTIDLYLLHDCQPYDVRSPELLEFLVQSKTSGKIRSFGIATDINSIIEIHQTHSMYTSVIQFENSIVTPNLKRLSPSPAQATITHRALSSNLPRLRELLDHHPRLTEAWSIELDIDLKDPKVLANAMLAYAASDNPRGIVLFSTTNISRVQSNIRAIENPILSPAKAQRFRELLEGLK